LRGEKSPKRAPIVRTKGGGKRGGRDPGKVPGRGRERPTGKKNLRPGKGVLLLPRAKKRETEKRRRREERGGGRYLWMQRRKSLKNRVRENSEVGKPVFYESTIQACEEAKKALVIARGRENSICGRRTLLSNKHTNKKEKGERSNAI